MVKDLRVHFILEGIPDKEKEAFNDALPDNLRDSQEYNEALRTYENLRGSFLWENESLRRILDKDAIPDRKFSGVMHLPHDWTTLSKYAENESVCIEANIEGKNFEGVIYRNEDVGSKPRTYSVEGFHFDDLAKYASVLEDGDEAHADE